MMSEWRLRQLPASARLVLTGFLAITAAGYLVSLANIYYSHKAADGQPAELSMRDVQAVYAGLEMPAVEGQAVPSRMLEMVDGKMREFLDTEADYQALRAWLVAGARAETFQAAAPGAEKSPHDILAESCVRCHNPEGEKGQEKAHKSPFAADILSPVDFMMVSKFTAAEVDAATGKTKAGPQSIEHLVLVGHVHMLSIPVFVLITSLLVLFTGLPGWLRHSLAAIPMLALVIDFSAWWLARKWGTATWLVVGAGAVFGVSFALQIVVTSLSMWFGRRTGAATFD